MDPHQMCKKLQEESFKENDDVRYINSKRAENSSG